MSVFAVAGYFSEAARRAAVAETYTTRSAGSPSGTFRRNRHGSCPIGVMLRADGYRESDGSPDPEYAAGLIYARSAVKGNRVTGPAAQRAICTATTAFIRAFDAGEIGDLAAALGAPARNASPTPQNRASATKGARAAKDAGEAR